MPRKRASRETSGTLGKDPVLRQPVRLSYRASSFNGMMERLQETTTGEGQRVSQVVELATGEFSAFLERFLRDYAKARGPARMEEAWNDTPRYWEMGKQGEVRCRRDPLRVAGLTTTEILRGFLEADFAEGWFNALVVRDAYQKVHGPIGLRSLSACLARLHRDGLMERGGNPRRWAYRMRGSKGPSLPGSREIVLP